MGRFIYDELFFYCDPSPDNGWSEAYSQLLATEL